MLSKQLVTKGEILIFNDLKLPENGFPGNNWLLILHSLNFFRGNCVEIQIIVT